MERGGQTIEEPIGAERATKLIVFPARSGSMRQLDSAVRAWCIALGQSHPEASVCVLKPASGEMSNYRIVCSFKCKADLEGWEAASANTSFLDKVEALTARKPDAQTATGLAAWFEATSGSAENGGQSMRSMPSRFKMSVVMYLGMLPMSLLVHHSLGLFPDVKTMPHLLLVAIATGLVVALTSYVAMPIITRLLSFWLKQE